jgi:hypothetical protein
LSKQGRDKQRAEPKRRNGKLRIDLSFEDAIEAALETPAIPREPVARRTRKKKKD